MNTSPEIFNNPKNTNLLYTEFSYSGNNVARLYHPPESPDTIQLIALHVERNLRGIGIGSKLFDVSLDHAKREGYEYFLAIAENERTAHLFKSRFDPEDLIIKTRIPGQLGFEPTDLTIDEAIDYLQFCREISPEQFNETQKLKDSVAIIAKIF